MDDKKFDFICDTNLYVAEWIDRIYDGNPSDPVISKKRSQQIIYDSFQEIFGSSLDTDDSRRLMIAAVLIRSAEDAIKAIPKDMN